MNFVAGVSSNFINFRFWRWLLMPKPCQWLSSSFNLIQFIRSESNNCPDWVCAFRGRQKNYAFSVIIKNNFCFLCATERIVFETLTVKRNLLFDYTAAYHIVTIHKFYSCVILKSKRKKKNWYRVYTSELSIAKYLRYHLCRLANDSQSMAIPRKTSPLIPDN